MLVVIPLALSFFTNSGRAAPVIKSCAPGDTTICAPSADCSSKGLCPGVLAPRSIYARTEDFGDFFGGDHFGGIHDIHGDFGHVGDFDVNKIISSSSSSSVHHITSVDDFDGFDGIHDFGGIHDFDGIHDFGGHGFDDFNHFGGVDIIGDGGHDVSFGDFSPIDVSSLGDSASVDTSSLDGLLGDGSNVDLSGTDAGAVIDGTDPTADPTATVDDATVTDAAVADPAATDAAAVDPAATDAAAADPAATAAAADPAATDAAAADPAAAAAADPAATDAAAPPAAADPAAPAAAAAPADPAAAAPAAPADPATAAAPAAPAPPAAPAAPAAPATPPAAPAAPAAPVARSIAARADGSCATGGINAATVDLIKQFEGFVASPAPDPIGLPTVGFGHLCKSAGCAEVPFSFPLSQDTAASLLQTDVKQFVSCVNTAVSDSITLNDNQVGALTAFSFNVGCGALKSSTLVKRLNAGEDANTVAAQEFPKFNKAGGKVLAGLTRRRAAEVALFQTASSVVAHPCT